MSEKVVHIHKQPWDHLYMYHSSSSELLMVQIIFKSEVNETYVNQSTHCVLTKCILQYNIDR
jgi:hypothetical protein